jgi:hypothetical protein
VLSQNFRPFLRQVIWALGTSKFERKMETDSIRVYVFKYSKTNFLELLRKNEIEHSEIQLFPAGTIVNSADAIEIIKAVGGASVIPALATVLVQWLKNKSSRKIIVQTKEKDVIHLEGYSIKEIESFLEKAENITGSFEK